MCWGYAVVILAVLAMHRWLGDLWWPATMLQYGPRWVWILPLPALALLACWRRPSLLLSLAVIGLITLGPVMGYCVSGSTPGNAELGMPVRVITCNTHGEAVDLDALAYMLEQTDPDIVALQEWPRESKYNAFFSGEQWSYRRASSDIAVASRHPIRAVEILDLRRDVGSGIIMRCQIELPTGLIEVYNLHLETPRPGLEAVRSKLRGGIPQLERRLDRRWRVATLAAEFIQPSARPVIVVGDFNMTTDGRLFQQFRPGFRDAFAEAGWGLGHTRQTRWHGARIDLILVDGAWDVHQCFVGPDINSDHLPVIAELRLPFTETP